MAAISFWLELLVFLGIAFQLLGFGFFIHFLRRRKPPPLPVSLTQPGVTVVKCCHLANDNEEENFDAFFRQDYTGPWQLLFVVSDASAPIAAVIQRMVAKYPNVDAELVVSRTRKAYWNKVDALYDGHQLAKHNLMIWSDSDAVVKTDYIRQMSACLQEPGVSVVTTPQTDIRANSAATACKALANNADIVNFMMAYDAIVQHKSVAFGHSIGFKKNEFDSFTQNLGWSFMNRYFADDQALPVLFAMNGKKVVFRDVYCPVQYSDKTWRQMLHQKVRWLLPQRIGAGGRLSYALGILLYPIIYATALLLLKPNTHSLALFGLAVATRTVLVATVEVWLTRSITTTLRYFWTVVLWDLGHVVFMPMALLKNHMPFEGRIYRLNEGNFLEEVLPESASEPVEDKP